MITNILNSLISIMMERYAFSSFVLCNSLCRTADSSQCSVTGVSTVSGLSPPESPDYHEENISHHSLYQPVLQLTLWSQSDQTRAVPRVLLPTVWRTVQSPKYEYNYRYSVNTGVAIECWDYRYLPLVCPFASSVVYWRIAFKSLLSKTY